MKITFLSCLTFFGLLLLSTTSAPAQLEWGVNGSGGSADWVTNWYSGSTHLTWVSGDTGTFTGTSGTVTLSSNQTMGGMLFASTSGTYTLVGNTSLINLYANSAITIEADSDVAINLPMLVAGKVTKTGTGTMMLGTNSNLISPLAINSGAVALTYSGSSVYSSTLGSITLGVAGTSSGTLALSPSGNGFFVGVSNITAQGNGNDTIAVTGTNVLSVGGTVSINNTTLTTTGTSSGNFTDVSIIGRVLATGNAALQVETTTSLSNTGNTIANITVSNNAGLIVASGVLPSNATITLNNGYLGLGSSATSATETIGSITGATGSIRNLSTTGTSNLTITGSSLDTYSGIIGSGVAGGSTSNNLSITQSGRGLLLLTGTSNTYTGGTKVTSGELEVNNTSGSATGSGTVSISYGAYLTGSGTINSSNIAGDIGGVVQPGTSFTDTTSVLTMTATGSIVFPNLAFNLDTTTPGQGTKINVGATPTVTFNSSTLLIYLQNSGTIADGTSYTLLTSSTTGTGLGGSVFDGFNLSYDSSTGIISGLPVAFFDPTYSDSNSYAKLVRNSNGGYDIDVVVESVPEPNVWMLLLVGIILLVLCRRRHRNA